MTAIEDMEEIKAPRRERISNLRQGETFYANRYGRRALFMKLSSRDIVQLKDGMVYEHDFFEDGVLEDYVKVDLAIKATRK